jgi:hypothetical protein
MERPLLSWRAGGGIRRRLALPVVLFLLASVSHAQSVTEYQVKAAYLFNFAKFVEWPAEAFPSADAPLQICVLGQDPFGREFEQIILDKTVNGHRIEVAFLWPHRRRQGCGRFCSL